MVNASLNWASIVGIVLAVCGGGLYFLRSFKPALARDYDVFFAAIGLLCGGILFFQGWRLDPILQFGQFLLAGTTVFFAYESVRLRGIATDQARRSSFFEDDQIPNDPRNSKRGRWEDEYDQFERPERISRRFKSRELDSDEDYSEDRYGERRVSRAIPESAASKRRPNIRDQSQFNEDSSRNRRYQADRDLGSSRNNFGERRTRRNEVKRGSRPMPNQNTSRQSEVGIQNNPVSPEPSKQDRVNLRTQTLKNNIEEASFTQKNSEIKKPRQNRRSTSTRSARDAKSSVKNQSSRYSVGSKKDKPRDNSSRFDD